ncbi:hypothetical protein ABZT47_17985 [Sphaerisporangium sp. NPDC005289]|uniref:hypothetical protein n=1 Tax=Sphaerisporangium sp. NPDC005289 TaxID=3155247 RepID=UPI0033A62478
MNLTDPPLAPHAIGEEPVAVRVDMTDIRLFARSALPCRTMNGDGWLADTRASYDTVAVGYADHIREHSGPERPHAAVP